MDSAASRRRSLISATLILVFGFVGSRLLGLVRLMVLAKLFGTSPEYSVYVAAFGLPDFLFQVVAGAVLGSAFLPTFTGYMAKGDRDGGWLLASSVLNAIAVVTVALSLLVWIFAPLLMPLITPGFRGAELDLEVQLTRIMLLSPVFFGVSGIMTGILNGQKHFLAPAIAPLTYNLCIIGGALFLGDTLGTRGLAIGVAAGAFSHLLVQLPALRSVGMRYRPRIALDHPGFREVGRLMVPRAIGLGAGQVNFLVVAMLASLLAKGSLAALNYAWSLMMMPLGIFGMAISAAVFPTLAEEASLDQMDNMKATFLSSLRMILFLTIPASLGLVVLREPVTAAIFERGEFQAASTQATALALGFYAVGLTAHGSLEIVNRAFFALHDTRTPVAAGLGSMLANVILCLVLSRVLEHGGLALAMSLATLAEAITLLGLLDRRMGGLVDRATAVSVGKTVVGSVVMAAAVFALVQGLPDLGLRMGGALAVAGLGVGVGGTVYFAATWLLRSGECHSVTRRVLRRRGI